jgi:diacylglycerol O-acyltransferase
MALMPITDAVFLVPERREQPMHVGSLQLFELPEGAGPGWVQDLYRRMLEATEVRTLFRRRPVRSLRTLGAWSWVVDDDVDLEHHVRHSALPRPGRVRELLALTSRLHGTLLDRQRPLWELHLIEGLEGGRFAIYTKIHHSLADGVSAIRLLRNVLTTDPSASVDPPWVPRPGDPDSQGGGLGLLTALPNGAARAAAELAGLGPVVARQALRALSADGRRPVLAPRTVLNVPITGSRRYAAQSWPLERVKAVAKASQATVNDIVLAMCASALREYLHDLGSLPDEPLVAMTPVSLRPKGSDEESGNAVGAILANLGTDVADPGERLDVIRGSMLAGKESMAGLSQRQATVLSALLMAPLALSATRSLAGVVPQPFNLIISNVPGPTETLYWSGARLTGLYPLSIPIDGQALNITVTSYDGSLDFGLTGDRRALPHLQRLLGHLDAGLEALAVPAGVAVG